MRFIRGDSLKEAIERFHADEALKTDPGRRSLELRKLLRRFIDVCNAIDYAHSRGVLHRDLKPGNVIVGKHGETLVVDWGLAKATGKAEPELPASGRSCPARPAAAPRRYPGSALGTPAYMSPEQAQGDLDQLGPRSDVYSLGATLYCLLTGRPPFEGDDIGEVLRTVQRGEFPPPRQVDPSIDRALEAVCLKAMALKPEDRYARRRALADDIERWMADEPVTAWTEPWTRTLMRWLTRHRTAYGNPAEAIRSFKEGVEQEVALKEDRLRPLRDKLLGSARRFYDRLGDLLKGKIDAASKVVLAESFMELAELIDEIGQRPDAQAAFKKAVAIRRELAEGPGAGAVERFELGEAYNAGCDGVFAR